ncbi:MAG TPA: glycosyltransferase family 2 protein, partial [Chitinophagaceae bacterium]|nr:glycosyltransferase family 2 protein [Chitinophagaceae bacterium]
KTGGVAGEKKIIGNHHSSGVGEVESIYWQYESFMKKQDAGFNTVVGAAGELFSIRKELFKEFEEDLLLDDFIISMNICLQGYRIAYEPGAFSTETPSASLVDEQQRKIRISAGAYQSIGYLKELLNVFKHPLLSFQYLFRRLFRWTLCPLLLPLLFLTNFLVVSNDNSNEFYKWIFIAQLFFYCLAFAGWFFVRSGRRMGPLNIPFYFIFMNYCLVRGFIVFLRGKETVLWKKSLREVIDS